MNLENRLRQVVQGVPEEGAVTLPVSAVRRWLEEADSGEAELVGQRRGEVADLTVSELADALEKSESTVRSWMPDVDGSYQLGNEWRVSREDWRAHLDSLADDGDDGNPAEVRSSPTASLSDWRDER